VNVQICITGRFRIEGEFIVMAPGKVTVLFLLRRVDCNDGVASYLETMIRGLRERGEKIVIVSGPVTQLYGSAVRYEALKAVVAEWIVGGKALRGRPTRAMIRAVTGAVRKHGVDVISPQGFSVYPLAFIAGLLTRRPVVANYHPSVKGTSAKDISIQLSPKQRLAYRAIATLMGADRFIAISKDIVRFFHRDCGVPERRIAYIPHGIDLTFFRPPSDEERRRARHAHGLADADLVCVLPGRLNLDKGHDVVVDAVRMLRERRPELTVVCLFPGGGDQAAQIAAYAHRDDADRAAFRFLGFLDAVPFRDAYWASDIGLLPSRFEGFGYVIAEAMSCGCVPVRTPSGGCDDQIVDGSNGFVIPFNDANALADRIGELADAGRRSVMRERALQHARDHFDQRTMIATTDSLYREVAGR
jgi:glycosyltransferase involved in cell wall biosynthesis